MIPPTLPTMEESMYFYVVARPRWTHLRDFKMKNSEPGALNWFYDVTPGVDSPVLPIVGVGMAEQRLPWLPLAVLILFDGSISGRIRKSRIEVHK